MHKYLQYIKKAIGVPHLVLFVVVQVMRNAGAAGAALVLSHLIDAVSTSIGKGGIMAIEGAAGIGCAYALGMGLITLASERMKSNEVMRLMVHMRHDVTAGILTNWQAKDASPACETLDASGSAKALTLLGQGMDTVEAGVFKNLCDILDAAAQMILATMLLVMINPVVAAISLAIMAVPAILPKAFGGKLAVCQKDILAATAVYNARVRDLAQGAEVTHSFHVEREVQDRTDDSAHDFEARKRNLGLMTGWVMSITNLVSISAQFIIMGVAGAFAVSGLITLGNIVAVTQLTGQVVSPASQLSSRLSRLRAAEAAWNQEMAAVGNDKVLSADAVSVEPQRSIELRDVCFSYSDSTQSGEEHPLLSGVNAEFRVGKKYAIVGKSGGGKSTLLRLASGRLEPCSGSLLVDGRRGVPDVAFVHQSVFLFDDTLRNNITLWGNYPQEEVKRVVELAGLSGVVDSLPEHLDTYVHENGCRLSGGERQRVAIARALLHRKTTLFVDEATSALDAATADKVRDVLLGLDGVMVVAVTHHLDQRCARRLDGVLELEDGHLRLLGHGDLRGSVSATE
ncbi:MAG: ABC transporter ATP-binding protein [Atopobiaceae bacterium]